MLQNKIDGLGLPFKFVSGSEPNEYNARFPYNLIHSGGTGDNEKFCIFLIKDRSVGQMTSPKGYIALPFPQELDDSVNVAYNTSSFGLVGALGVGSLTNNFEFDADKLTNVLKKGISSINREAFLKVAAGLALKAAPGLKAAVNNATGTIENPFMTNTLSGVGFREFSFTFNLIPKNERDSVQLSNLIYIFKKAMMPTDKTEDAGFDGRIGLNVHQNTGIQKMPDLFDVKFYPTTESFTNTDTGKLLLTIRDAVMTKFDVSYSNETSVPVFYNDADNSPFSATISMNLKETVIYTRERCEEDYADILNENF